MAYNEEPSDYKASGNNIKNVKDSITYNSIVYNDNLKNQIIEGLKELLNISHQPTQSNLYENLYCVDGSLVSIDNGLNEFYTLRVGDAILNPNDLFNIQKDKYGNVNPYQVADLYQNSGNSYIDGLFPSKNSYIYDDNKFYTMKESFIKALDNLFDYGLAKEIKDRFYSETKDSPLWESKDKISGLKCIKMITSEIREDSIVFNTQTEVQKIMLITEAILSQYLLHESANKKEKGLIVLDGRLENKDLGDLLIGLNEHKINTPETMLVGVQKTGKLNILLSKVHEVIKKETFIDGNLNKLKEKYNDNQSILFVLNKEFKKKFNLRNSGNGIYGQDCFYITEGPNRKEFVFTLPFHFFTDRKYKGLIQETLNSITSVLEHANTDIYLLNKGVLLTNVIAHANVSLNKKYTSVLGQEAEKIIGKQNKYKL